MRTSIGIVAVCCGSFVATTTSNAAIVLSATGTVTSSTGTMYDSASNSLVAVPTTGTPVSFTYAISTTDFGSFFVNRGDFLYDAFVISAGSWNYSDPITSTNNHLVDNGFSPDLINHFFQSTPIGTTNVIRLSTVASMTYLDNTLASYPGTGLPFDDGFDYSNFLSGGTLRVEDLTTSGNFEFSVDSIQTIPEPSAFALAALGFAGLLAIGWRRRKRS